MKAPMKIDTRVLRREALEKENQKAIFIERKILEKLGEHPRIVPSVIIALKNSIWSRSLSLSHLQISGRTPLGHPAFRGISWDSAGIHRLQPRRHAHISALGFLRTIDRGHCAHSQQGGDSLRHATRQRTRASNRSVTRRQPLAQRFWRIHMRRITIRWWAFARLPICRPTNAVRVNPGNGYF